MSTTDNLFSLDYEQAVLSLLMLDFKNEAFDTLIKKKITEETFYFPANKDIFKACLELYKKNQPINEVSVRQKLIELNLFEKILSEDAKIKKILRSVSKMEGIEYYSINILTEETTNGEKICGIDLVEEKMITVLNAH